MGRALGLALIFVGPAVAWYPLPSTGLRQGMPLKMPVGPRLSRPGRRRSMTCVGERPEVAKLQVTPAAAWSSQTVQTARQERSVADLGERPEVAKLQVRPAAAVLGERPEVAKLQVMPAAAVWPQKVQPSRHERSGANLRLGSDRDREKEDCLEQNDAIYTILWQKTADGTTFRAVGEYTTERRKRAQQQVRGDSKTFASEMVKAEFPATGQGPLARAASSGEEVVVTTGDDGFLRRLHSPRRRALAKEFDIKHIHFVPCSKDGMVVMEYGRYAGEVLSIPC